MLNIFAFLIAGLLSTQPVAVTSCGADPTGKSDSASAFQRCLQLVPSGDLVVPYGTYILNHPIFKTRRQNIIGMGANASILKCQALTTPCIVAADTTGGPNNYTPSKIQDLAVVGPGSNTLSTGILFGGDPSGALISSSSFGDGVSLVDVRITGFQHGLEWGNNAWSNKIVRSFIFSNAVGLYTGSGLNDSGEAVSITDSNIFNNITGIEDNAGFEWMITGSSLDYNTTAFLFYGSYIHAVNCHFEQSGAQVFSQPSGYAALSLKDSEIIIQSSMGAESYILNDWPQSLNLSIDNLSIWSNHPVQYFMHSQGNTTGTISNIYGNGNRLISAFADGPTKATVSDISSF